MVTAECITVSTLLGWRGGKVHKDLAQMFHFSLYRTKLMLTLLMKCCWILNVCDSTEVHPFFIPTAGWSSSCAISSTQGVQLPTKRETIAWSVDCARTYDWHVLFPIAFMTYNVNVLHMYHIICGNLKNSANDSYFVLREHFRQF